MNPQEAIRYLDSFINLEKIKAPSAHPVFKLQRVAAVLDLLHRPHDNIPCIHVAGTKGKGSTCAYVAHILRCAGCSVGLYTSPHLWDFRERIRILRPDSPPVPEGELFGGCISEEDFCSALQEMQPALKDVQAREEESGGPLTYFEVLTVLALYYFRQKKVHCLVLETGLGGRLDATNVVDADICGLTPVSLDHTAILGPSLKEIAKEKAGIVKSRSQAVLVADQPEEVRAVLAEHVRRAGCQAYFMGRDIQLKDDEQQTRAGFQHFSVQGLKRDYKLCTGLLGRHQSQNAAMAVGLAEMFMNKTQTPVSRQAVQEGIGETFWPGRFEKMGSEPDVVLDVAHNPDSMLVLARTIRQYYPRKRIVLLVGISRDKDQREICRTLATMAEEVVITQADHPRAADLDVPEIRNLFSGRHFYVSQNVKEGVSLALARAQRDDLILVTGSIFVVGEARKIFLKMTQR